MTQAASKPIRQFRGRLARTILLVLLPLAMFPVLLMGGAATYRSYSLLSDQFTTQLENVAEAQTDQAASIVSTKKDFLVSLVSQAAFTQAINLAISQQGVMPDFQDSRDRVMRNYESIVHTNAEPPFDQMLVVLPDGKILIATNPEWEGKQVNANSILQELMEKQGSSALYNPFPLYNNRFVLVHSQPFVNGKGEIQATIMGLTQSSNLQQILEFGLAIHPRANAYFFTRDGYWLGFDRIQSTFVVVHPNANHLSTILPMFAGSHNSGHVEFKSFNDQDVLAQTDWLPGLQAGVVVEIPRNVIDNSVNSLVTFAVGTTLLTILVLGVFIGFGSRYVVNPIQELTETTRRFADGEWSTQAKVTRNDELGLLAYSFNQMAEELTAFYRNLESKVEAHTQQVRIAAEVAQAATTAQSVNELTQLLVGLIVERFGFYNASIFMINTSHDQAVMAAQSMSEPSLGQPQILQLPVGSQSMVGWVTMNDRPLVAQDVTTEPYYVSDPNLPDTRSEAVVPISVNNQVLGALDVQSKDLNAFSPEAISILQTLANQIGTAITNIRLLESTQGGIQEVSHIYMAGHKIAQTLSYEEVWETLSKQISKVHSLFAIFETRADRIIVHTQSKKGELTSTTLALKPSELKAAVSSGEAFKIVDNPTSNRSLPTQFLQFLQGWGCEQVVLLPIYANGELAAVTMIGSEQANQFNPIVLQPYVSLMEITGSTLEKLDYQKTIQERVNELQALNSLSEIASVETNMLSTYQFLHQKISEIIGNVGFLIALYDAETQMIEIPYMYDGNSVTARPPFSLGQGLTSIIIKTKKPLMIIENTEQRTAELGAIVIGSPAKSWLGVPLLVSGNPIGAIVVQDTAHERAFNENHQRLLSTVAAQVAFNIYNTRLIEQTRLSAERERRLYDVTRKIRSSVDMQSILTTTATELGLALGVARARIEIGSGLSPERVEDRQPGNGNDGHPLSTE